MTAVIDIRSLSVGFVASSELTLNVLRDCSLTVRPGETVGIVGESGSGKSTLALASMGFLRSGLRVLEGSVHFEGQDMFGATPETLNQIRGGKLGLVPQNAGQSLTPTLRIGTQLREALELHCPDPAADRAAQVIELLKQVRLPDPAAIARRFPHELSGGQQQRVAIAMALAGEPDVLVLDEPTTGLDVTTQAHLLRTLDRLSKERTMAMVLVSHDLGVIAHVCERVLVMYAGEVVLEGPTAAVLSSPAHPYARALISSVPRISDTCLPVALDGSPPLPCDTRTSCAFAPRCPLATDACAEAHPQMQAGLNGQHARCLRMDALAEVPDRITGEAVVHQRPSEAPLLEIDNLAVQYHQPGLFDRLLGRAAPPATVQGFTASIRAGETMALVGESGSGKSTILKTLAGLWPPCDGEIRLDGTALPTTAGARRPETLRRIQLILQNPDASLNPRHTIAQILAQPLRLYFGLSGEALRKRSAEVLETVRLNPAYLDRLPGQLSGGEKQRVAVARAFAAGPDLVLCDEITSALDVSVQAAVLDLLNQLKARDGTTFIFVSHDLAVVSLLADRVAVLYQGRLCEYGPTRDVYGPLSHPYTHELLNAVLEPEPGHVPRLELSDVTELAPPAHGCPFQRRCPRHLGAQCNEQTPPAQLRGDGHVIHCHIPLDDL